MACLCSASGYPSACNPPTAATNDTPVVGTVQRDSITITILSYVGIVIGYVNKILLLPNFFSETQVGLVNILVSFSVIYAQFSALGINFTIVKFFPFFRTEDRTHNGLFFWSGVGVSFGFILFTLLFLLFRNPVMEYYSQESPLLSQYYLLLIPMGFTTLFYNFFTSWLQAFHKNVISSFSNEIVLRLLVTIEISLYVFKVLTFEQFVIGYVLIYFVPTVILLIYTLRLHYTRYKPCFSRRVKKLASIASVYGFWQYLGGTSNYIVPTVDQAMLAGMWGLAENGIYGIMLCLVSVMQMPYRSLVKVSTPVVTELWKARDFQGMRHISREVSLMNLIAGCYLFVIIWVNLDNIFSLMPEQYSAGRYVFLFLGLGRIIDMYSGLNSAILMTSKKYRYEFLMSLFLVGLTIGTNLLLIPRFGMNGAALATMISIIIFNIGHVTFVWRFYRIQPFALKDSVVALIGLLSIGVSALIPTMGHFILDAVIRTLIITAVFGIPIYLSGISPTLNTTIERFYHRIFR